MVPEHAGEHLDRLLEERAGLGRWAGAADEGLRLATTIVRADELEPLLDELSSRFSHEPAFRAVVLTAQAVLPRPESGREEPEEGEDVPREPRLWRVSREELYGTVAETARVTPVFAAMVLISTVVACVGLRQGSPAVVIGAMVIAPLLGPNLALALATTLWDRSLLGVAWLANGVGAGLAFALSVAVGWLAGADVTTPEIAARIDLSGGDVLLALAAGAAGALSFTTGAPTSLIGVMVAVALLPPLATSGMLLGAGFRSEAFGAGLLTAANVIGVNLAGMLVFAVQGVRPRRWWHAERAAWAARIAGTVWVLLLVAILAAILVRRLP